MFRKSLVSMPTVALLMFAVSLATCTQVFAADRDHARDDKTLKVDVAIDAATFSPNNNDPSDPSNPKRGTTFIVTGKIFPAGTIPPGVTSFDPNQPGSIGLWACRGVFLADLADIMSGKAKHAFDTTQLFFFPDDNNLIAVEGIEGSVGVTTQRVVLGGTGMFTGVSGTASQETIGLNQNGNGLFDLRFTLNLKRTD